MPSDFLWSRVWTKRWSYVSTSTASLFRSATILPPRAAAFRSDATAANPVCRGMQLINSALGGNMHEHLPLITDGSIVHSAPASKAWSILHEVTVEPDSFLAKAVGVTRLPVNSFHHMSLKKLGDGLRCVATTDDGVVEAVENADGTIAGVQWHPECLFDRMPEQKKIFEAFVALVQKTMQQATA